MLFVCFAGKSPIAAGKNPASFKNAKRFKTLSRFSALHLLNLGANPLFLASNLMERVDGSLQVLHGLLPRPEPTTIRRIAVPGVFPDRCCGFGGASFGISAKVEGWDSRADGDVRGGF